MLCNKPNVTYNVSLVPLWSGVSVAGVQFRDIIPNIGLETDDEKWHEIMKEVVKLRVSNNFILTGDILLFVSDLVLSILKDNYGV